jgi:hypothetical protein
MPDDTFAIAFLSSNNHVCEFSQPAIHALTRTAMPLARLSHNYIYFKNQAYVLRHRLIPVLPAYYIALCLAKVFFALHYRTAVVLHISRASLNFMLKTIVLFVSMNLFHVNIQIRVSFY